MQSLLKNQCNIKKINKNLIICSALNGRIRTLSKDEFKLFKLVSGFTYQISNDFKKSVYYKDLFNWLQKNNKSVATPKCKINNLYLELTRSCNLNCSYCINKKEALIKKDKVLSFKEILNLVEQFKSIGGQHIIISGGEPLLYPDLKILIEYILKSNLFITIKTNGTIFSEYTKKLIHPNIYWDISIDSANESIHDRLRGVGVLNLIKKNLIEFRKNDANLGACAVVISETNIGKERDIIKFAINNGFKQISFTFKFDLHNSNNSISAQKFYLCLKRLFKYMLEFKDKIVITGNIFSQAIGVLSMGGAAMNYSCDIGRILKVDPSGNIYPCPYLNSKEKTLGNIRKIKLKSLLNKQSKLNIYTNDLFKNNERDIHCKNCFWSRNCGGECLVKNLQVSSKKEIPILCQARNKFYSYILTNL